MPTAPRVYIEEHILFSKATIFAALQQAFPSEMTGLQLADLEWYGVDGDVSFSRFEFSFEDLGNGKFQKKILRFEQGAIIQLLQALSPTLFANKTIDQLVSYADDENDPTMVRFIFKEMQQ